MEGAKGSLVLVFTAILVACVPPEDTKADDTGAEAVEDTALQTTPSGDGAPAYADVAPVLDQHCNGCHGDPPSGAPLTLVGYDAAAAQADRMVARAVDGDPSAMPPGGLSLSNAEMQVLVDWAAAGAPR